MDDVSNRLRRVIAEALNRDVDPNSIVGDDLVEELQLSSVDALELLIWIEEEFGIEIPDEDLNRDLIQSLGGLERYVAGRVGSARSA